MTTEASATAAWLGIEAASTSAQGEAVLEMPTREEMGNRSGVLHGGFMALLADSAMGRALASVLPEGEKHYSFDLKLNFISTGRIGERLRAVARVLHSGRRTGVTECRVEGQDGRLVAAAEEERTDGGRIGTQLGRRRGCRRRSRSTWCGYLAGKRTPGDWKRSVAGCRSLPRSCRLPSPFRSR